MYVKIVLANTSPFSFENGLVSGPHGMVAQGCRAVPRLGCFSDWGHLEKQDGRHLEILFVVT